MTNANPDGDLTLVLGATGKTGSRVARRLADAGRPVRLGSRAATPRFGWEDEDTWVPALDGVSAVYVAYQPDLAVPGAVGTVERFFDRAVLAGVEKIVLLSGRGETEAEQAEAALMAAGVDWTILRSSWFCQNFSESFFLDPILAGEVALPAGPVAEPFVDVEDIADIAFAALTQARHGGKLYEITGPQALTFSEAIATIAGATGRDIRYRETVPEAFRSMLVEAQVPAEHIELILYLFATVLDGRNTPLSDGVERALGRVPGSFSDYVRRTAAGGVWRQSHG